MTAFISLFLSLILSAVIGLAGFLIYDLLGQPPTPFPLYPRRRYIVIIYGSAILIYTLIWLVFTGGESILIMDHFFTTAVATGFSLALGTAIAKLVAWLRGESLEESADEERRNRGRL